MKDDRNRHLVLILIMVLLSKSCSAKKYYFVETNRDKKNDKHQRNLTLRLDDVNPDLEQIINSRILTLRILTEERKKTIKE